MEFRQSINNPAGALGLWNFGPHPCLNQLYVPPRSYTRVMLLSPVEVILLEHLAVILL